MNGPTKTVGPPWTPLPARKSKGVLEKVLDDADAVIDGDWETIDDIDRLLGSRAATFVAEMPGIRRGS